MQEAEIHYVSDDGTEEVVVELSAMREAEQALLEVEPVSPEAAVRRDESLARLRSEITRVEGLLSRPGASEGGEAA